jgi:hypothetical protein
MGGGEISFASQPYLAGKNEHFIPSMLPAFAMKLIFTQKTVHY